MAGSSSTARADVVVRAQRAAGRDDHALPAQAPGRAHRRSARAPGPRRSSPGLFTSTRSLRSPSTARPRSRLTVRRRRSISPSPIFSVCSTAAWVSAFTPSTGATASSRSTSRADRVAGAQARQAVDLRERAHHEQAREGVDQAQARRRTASASWKCTSASSSSTWTCSGSPAEHRPELVRRACSRRSGRWGCRRTSSAGAVGDGVAQSRPARRSRARAPARAAISG